ncbi:TetR/AcrR family transcriptional regulator [Burkholderia gladioli]
MMQIRERNVYETPHDNGLNDTQLRILDAAEQLFIEHGLNGIVLRQVTSRSSVNLAAISYHFGGKNTMIQIMLSRRLDILARDYGMLLHDLMANPDAPIECGHILCAFFVTLRKSADRMRYDRQMLLRFLIRTLYEPSESVQQFLRSRYFRIVESVNDGLRTCLPHLAPTELSWRIQCVMYALCGFMAHEHNVPLLGGDSDADASSDELLSRIVLLCNNILTSPDSDSAQFSHLSPSLASRLAWLRSDLVDYSAYRDYLNHTNRQFSSVGSETR